MRLDRIEREEPVLVDIINCMANPELNDTHLSGKTVDVSENGMKVITSVELPPDTIVGLRLDIAAHLYRLEGEVRWSKEDLAGLLLDESSADFDHWTEMFELDF